MRRRLRPDDRGVALVEAALALPVLFLIAFGLIDFGSAWREANSFERSTHQAARVGSNVANERFADYEALRALDAAEASLKGTVIERVVVFRATTLNSTVPAACKNLTWADPMAPHGISSGSTRCNVYSPEQLSTENPIGFQINEVGDCASGSWDQAWCPTSRVRTQSPNPDYFGIWVSLKFQPFSGFFFASGLRFERLAIFGLEPCVAGVSSC